MHEKILQAATVGIVAGAVYFWLRTQRQYAHQTTCHGTYAPVLGDVRRVRGGKLSSTYCNICGDLVSPDNTPIPLASDYIWGSPVYKPATSNWNLGESMNACCQVSIGNPCAGGMNASCATGVNGPCTVPSTIKLKGKFSCNPDVGVPADCCAEVI